MYHTVTNQTNDFVAALLPEAIEHERIPADAAVREDRSIKRYLSAAIQAAQNYLDKDVWPTEHTYAGIDLWPFEWTRGNVRSINAIVPEIAAAAQPPGYRTDGLITPELLAAAARREVSLGRDPDRIKITADRGIEPDPMAIIPSIWTPPAGWVDYGVAPLVDGGTDLRAARLRIGWPAAATFGGQLVIEGGFAAAADIPDDVVQFILTTFGAFYELREIANYSSMVFKVDIYPLWLLDPYRTLSYA
jgi:hypothetical protein